jgi:hypothetical protein
VEGVALSSFPNETNTEFSDLFSASLRQSTRGGKFEAANFFEHWFRNQGKAYFFLFKNNLRVTNIQFGELIALVRVHLKLPDGRKVPNLRFVSFQEFRWLLKRLHETFDLTSEQGRTYVAAAYAPQFGRTLVLDPFFCSCALYLPPPLDADLRGICGESGYIHSCGANLLTKLIYHTRGSDLDEALGRFVKSITDRRMRFFAVYAREDWPTGSEKLPKFLQDGLEQVKIPVGKYFMGPQRLSEVLKNLRGKRKYKSKIFFAEPGRLDTSHAEFKKKKNTETQKIIFLIADQQVSDVSKQPKDVRFYICYEQYYINENPFHLFDEDKPGWIDHTTIPHTLAGAMINITRPWWPDRTVRVCDPFSGTGTFWFEGIKLLRVSI